MNSLGTLTKVDLREVWQSESANFTPWLASEENIGILGETIAMELEVEVMEKNIGPFRADILCKDTDNGNWVLVENQLERTDHNHLGQLLTYAAGLHAVTIVWVAAIFTDEHRATLDWLNEITDDRFQFFGLEIQLWQIDNSPAAPKFNIVSKPNNWSRSVSQYARRVREGTLTKTQEKQLRFFTALKKEFEKRNTSIQSRKPLPQHWTDFGIGRAGFHISATINSREKRKGVDLYLGDSNAKSYYHLLYEQKDEIEKSIGHTLKWMELPERKASAIGIVDDGLDLDNEINWPSQLEWFVDMIEKFDNTFRDRVRSLDASDWQPDQDDNEENEVSESNIG